MRCYSSILACLVQRIRPNSVISRCPTPSKKPFSSRRPVSTAYQWISGPHSDSDFNQDSRGSEPSITLKFNMATTQANIINGKALAE